MKLRKIKNIPKNCKHPTCQEKGIVIEGDELAASTTGIVICNHCGTRHVYEMSKGKLLTYRREGES